MLPDNPPSMTETTRERNLLEAWFHGCAVILLVVAATAVLVFGLLLACGASLTWDHAGMLALLVGGAGGLELFARLARTRP